MGNECSKPKPLEPEELMRHMDNNPDVVMEYYQSRQHLISNFVQENLWEEDVIEWLEAIRKRSPKENLQVRKVDFLKEKNTQVNCTSMYENSALVIRRASSFDVDVFFGNRAFDADRDDLTVCLSLGKKPSVVTKTKFVCSAVSKAGEKTQWFCQILGKDNATKKLSLRINVPADAIVARYGLSLGIVSGTASGRVTTQHKGGSVIVLFNPLAKDDTVYMEDPRMRSEYVFADEGFINIGPFWGVEYAGQKKWDFAQFDEGVLDSTLLLLHEDSRSLEEPEKSYKRRSDPVYVARVLSAMVNCNDDKGVIEGRWNGDYEGGTKPWSWNDSGKILEEWRNNDMAPVKYGQCWVFSGLLTTVLRAIGIPSRSVTNYSSAHDTNRNVTIDIYYDVEKAERIATSDSIWNFHVWNEAYFDRPDLAEGYGGWQVVDATPQELSRVQVGSSRRSLSQCGPAPVKAIKNGEITIGFDTNFIFSEVNADKVTWFVKDGEIVGPPKIETNAVGECIATKAIGEMRNEDITLNYKYKEGSEEERVAYKKAYGRGTREHRGIFANAALAIKPTYEITIESKKFGYELGLPVKTIMKIKNLTKKASTTSLKISAKAKRHTGVLHKLLKKVLKDFTLEGGKVAEFNFELTAEEYLSGIVDDREINILVLATDTADGNTVAKEVDVSLTIPKLIWVDIPKVVPKDKETKFSVTFKNNLPVPLTNGSFEISFRGAKSTTTDFDTEKPIAAGGSYKVEGVTFKPFPKWKKVNCKIAFQSKEVKDIIHLFTVATE